MHACDSYNTQWVIDSCDPNDRFERQGEPVKAGEPILIRHCQTNHYLASDSVVEKNDFGSEYEVMTHDFATMNKTQNLELEKKGNITVDVPTRIQNDQNVWVLETAPSAVYDAPISDLQKYNIGGLKEDMSKFFSPIDPAVVDACFNAIDANQIDEDDFRWAIIDLGYQLSKQEASEIVRDCDKSGSGCITLKAFKEWLC